MKLSDTGGTIEITQFHKFEDGRKVSYSYSIIRDKDGIGISRTEPVNIVIINELEERMMQVKIYDIYGDVKIEGEYESFADCIAKNKRNLRYTDLRGANLIDANLRGANLKGANLRGANLRGANLIDADLRDANLRGADLRDANLRGANLRDADLRGADLRDANLIGANLRGADLRGADLRDANLIDANLRGANIDVCQLYYANCANIKLDSVLVKIQGSRDLFCYYNGEIKIGCESHTLKEWLEHGAYTTDYTPEEQSEYMRYIKMIDVGIYE